MKNIVKAFFITSVATGAAMAESFGGVGLSVYADNGVITVDDVIPGTPAEISGIQVGDVIIDVDGVSLIGSDLETAKSTIRGIVNKPTVITYTNADADTLQTTIRRSAITTVTVDAYSGSFDKKDSKLLAVVDVGENELQAVYIGTEIVSNGKSDDKSKSDKGDIKLIEVENEAVTFDLKKASDVMVTFASIDGTRVARFRVDNASIGHNVAHFDATRLPRGSFTITVETANSRSSRSIMLK